MSPYGPALGPISAPDLRDAPLSDHGEKSGGKQEMASGDDGAGEATGTVPIGLARLTATITRPTFNLIVAPGVPEGSDLQLGDPEDEKARGASSS